MKYKEIGRNFCKGRRINSETEGGNQNKNLTVEQFNIKFRYMSNIRKDNFEKYADIFKALANENRLKIFCRLASCCKPGTVGIMPSSQSAAACVGELGGELDIVPSTVSHHIKELRRVGLIKTRRKGQSIECWVDPDVVSELQRFFNF